MGGDVESILNYFSISLSRDALIAGAECDLERSGRKLAVDRCEWFMVSVVLQGGEPSAGFGNGLYTVPARTLRLSVVPAVEIKSNGASSCFVRVALQDPVSCFSPIAHGIGVGKRTLAALHPKAFAEVEESLAEQGGEG